MFYNLNQEDLLKLEQSIAKIIKKLEALQGLTDIKSINKSKHLNECKEFLNQCLEKKDKDKYDFFIYEIYELTWGSKPFDEIDESEKIPANLKVDKYQENIPSLKEIAQGVLKEEVDELINNHPLMLEKLKDYDENGIPRKITIRQAKLALLEAGLLDDIEVMIQSADKSIQINWEYATEFERKNELILFFQQQTKLSDAFVDELFIKAKEY
ncbi:TPA: hypothetical protein RTG46_001394 [Campylobacter jejuni]|nr:hypothetical protein C414_000260148 [Campylobacter jejuni subsp. jejuni 414]HDZ5006189.1 hypothetical protein [Campylobacter jejuni]HDZ5012839.1 hypothetical protein [Campylobacter jejuni]HDZ5016267.1 hypothetical protein [Campylobacter jejuni]HDZ5024392.1 hypothetical protein [Campylobacter jejuni]